MAHPILQAGGKGEFLSTGAGALLSTGVAVPYDLVHSMGMRQAIPSTMPLFGPWGSMLPSGPGRWPPLGETFAAAAAFLEGAAFGPWPVDATPAGLAGSPGGEKLEGAYRPGELPGQVADQKDSEAVDGGGDGCEDEEGRKGLQVETDAASSCGSTFAEETESGANSPAPRAQRPASSSGTVLKLEGLVQLPRGLPSMGSEGHFYGVCKPCAFVFKEGCESGPDCKFCHLCLPGERRRRKKELKMYRQAMRQAL